MKSKNWQEIRGMSVIELESKLRASKEQLFRLQFKHSSTPLKNALEIRKLRKNVAQYNTLLREKELSAAASSASSADKPAGKTADRRGK